MTVLVIITYKLDFSNQVIEYFKSQNICNGYKFSFLAVGMDEGSEEEVYQRTIDKLESYKSLETVTIFADAGLPNKLAKRIKLNNKNINVLRSKGSLIENGFLTYMMLNTRSPIESIKLIIDEKVEK